MAAPDGEARGLATAQHIVKALGTTDTMTDDMLHILSKFDHRFSSMNAKEDVTPEPSSSHDSDVEDYPPRTNRSTARNSTVRNSSQTRANNFALDAAQNVISQWTNGYSDRSGSVQAGQKWIFEGSEEDSLQFLQAVDEIVHQLDFMKIHNRDPGTLERAQNLHHLALQKLLEEFRYMLDKYSEKVDPDWLLDLLSAGYFRAPANDAVDPESGSSDGEDDEDEDVPVAYPVDKIETSVDLVPPQVAADLADIAKRLIGGEYKRECTDMYVKKRKVILEGSLYELGVERVTIDEVQKMQWEVQEDRIKKWNQAMNVGVKVLFASEKQLCDELFPLSLSENIFNEIGKGAMMQLLSFGEAIAISRRSPEKLFKVLDMYEVLRDILPELDVVFAGASGASVRSEAEGILMRLGEAARGTFGEFENAIQRDASKTPVLGGAVHPLNRYVMNYIKLLCDYTETLKLLFGKKKEVPKLLGDDPELPGYGDDYRGGREELSPLAVQINWLMHVLQNNLETKSKIHKDPALSSLFLMNNVHYMVQKVKDSEVRALIGDDWVKKHTSMLRQYATNYQRAAWSKVLSFLKDEGIQSSGGSSNISRAILKDRFKNFNAAFDDAHRIQSQWVVYGDELRDELRISIADKLLPAYRAFVGRYRNFIENGRHPDKYIKYQVEDLEVYIGDFFSGNSPSINSRRKSFSSQ